MTMPDPQDPVAEAERALWEEIENYGAIEGMFYNARKESKQKALAQESLQSGLKTQALARRYAALKALAEVRKCVKAYGCTKPYMPDSYPEARATDEPCVHYDGKRLCKVALREALEKEAAGA